MALVKFHRFQSFFELFGRRAWNRTRDPLLRRQMLYPLSYAAETGGPFEVIHTAPQFSHFTS